MLQQSIRLAFASFMILSVSMLSVSMLCADERPNIVMIMADDLGFECIGAHGGTSYKTPVLDQMAKEGVMFRHCYSQPICTPSRVKLMTGMSNKRNYAKFGFLEQSQVTFGNLLRDAGYKTAICGKWQLGADTARPKHFGFDEHCLWHLTKRPSRYASPAMETNGIARNYKPGYGPDVVTEFALDFIDRNKSEPFLLYYPMILTHCPFEPTPDSKNWDPASPGSETYKGDAKYFGDMVTYMDGVVGKILNQLEKSGVRDNTLVLFTGDNGTDTPVVSMMGDVKVIGQKGKTTDGGTHVPCIAQWAGKTPKGFACDDIIDFSDFLPTMCEAAGVSVPADRPQDGRSFLPQVTGKPGNPRDWIHIWYARNGGAKGAEFTRDQRYKLYASGKFYDVANDRMEKMPLQKSALEGEAKAVHEKLATALATYDDTRSERFANWVANEKKNKTKKNGKNKKSQKKEKEAVN